MRPYPCGTATSIRLLHSNVRSFGEAALVQPYGGQLKLVLKQVSLAGFTRDQAEAIFVEADALRCLDHPNVLKCYAVWVDASLRESQLEPSQLTASEPVVTLPLRSKLLRWEDSEEPSAVAVPKSLLIVTEYVDGGSLLQLINICRSKGHYADAFLVDMWLAQLVLGIEHIHSRGLIHRDIKV